MAAVKAVKSGNWSDPTVWNTGALPNNGDSVYSNAFTVAIDQNVTIGGVNNSDVNAGSFVAGQRYIIKIVGTTTWTSIGASVGTVGIYFTATGAGSGTGVATQVASITTSSSTGTFTATAGGGFTLSSSYNIDAHIVASGAFTALTISAGNYNSTITGNIYGGGANPAKGILNSSTGLITVIGNIYAGPQTSTHGLSNTGNGNVNITGDIYGGNSNNDAYGVLNSGIGTITITGNIYGGVGPTNCYGVYNSSSGSISVTGSITGGFGSLSYGLYSSSSGSVQITGNIYAGTLGAAVKIESTGSCLIVGTFTATNGANAFVSNSTSATNRLNGSFINASNGTCAIYSAKYILNTTPLTAKTRIALDGISTYVDFFTADNSLSQALISDVRYGISYASGNLIGILRMPTSSQVSHGIEVDNTIGNAVLSIQSVIQAIAPLI
jgi:fibronectin-binding autotransporter adhesin